MPRGPQGQWRPKDPNAAAVMACKIAIGEIEEQYEPYELVKPEQEPIDKDK